MIHLALSFTAVFFLIGHALAKPNIILIMTDDQGYGGPGSPTGNPKIKTPNLDAFAKQSMQLRHFYVSPVCSPTRSSLMTGRYTYRTGIVDTAYGRSMMHADETTLAEVLGANGYRTGIFGKWHLGDNYPMRAMDQGFQEALVLKGGGLGQPSDLPDGTSYFDPLMLHNGKIERQKGYVSDVITSAAIDFVSQQPDKPFFVYLPFNCPHTPLEVSDEELKPYKDMNLALSEFPKTGFPIGAKYNVEMTARIYAMISNIDKNLGRLFKTLDEKKLADNTIVMFLTDNGPQQPRYVSGFRGLKGTVYEGGIRVAFYARWPGKFPAGQGSDAVSMHIDILPTILEACEIPLPKGLKIDGVSRLNLLRGDKDAGAERTVFQQWHRGDVPDLNRSCMARGPRWKIVQPTGVPPGPPPKNAEFELYDIPADPYEQNNLAAKHPEIVTQMRQQYEAWFADVKKEREFKHPFIILGSEKEPAAFLTRQDWHGAGNWELKSEGHWDVSIDRPGTYRVTVYLDPKKAERDVHVQFDGHQADAKVAEEKTIIDNLKLKKVSGKLEAWATEAQSKDRYGVKYLHVERTGD